MNTPSPLKVRLHVDGGARGNPGPAAGAYVLSADDGTVLGEAGIFLGKATNNVAEYRGLIEGLRAAGQIGAAEVEVLSDSELMVRQMTGRYRVRNDNLLKLYEEARILAAGFSRVAFRHVRREQNTEADRLVNQALNLGKNTDG